MRNLKKKIGITMNSKLYRKVKVYCARNDVSISEFIEYAVNLYLQRVEMIEREMKNMEIGYLVEDNYSNIIKQDLEIKEIPGEE